MQDINLTHEGACEIWYGLSVPAEGAEIFISATTGIPDTAGNPLAKRVGFTEKGALVSLGKTVTEEFFDEYKESLNQNIDSVTMSIKCDAAEILDWDLLEAATVGIGTVQTAAGKKKIKIGEGVLTYSGIAVIFPLRADPTKFGVCHIYRGYQVNSLDINISRQERAKMSLEFKGVGIPGRVKNDSMGAVWKTI